MAFLDKIGAIAKNAADKTGEIARNAVDKTSDMIEINRLKSDINSEERAIEEAKARIGEYYYNKYKDTDSMDAEIKKEFLSIKVSLTEIEKLNLQIEEIKEGKDDDIEVNTPVAESVQSSVITCPNCGAKNPVGSKFCTECGTKLAE